MSAAKNSSTGKIGSITISDENKVEYGRVHDDASQSRQDMVKAEKWTLVFKSWSENICPAGPERTEKERNI